MHLFLKKIYRKNPFPKIYRINQCEVLSVSFFWFESAVSNIQACVYVKETTSLRANIEGKVRKMFESEKGKDET